MLYLRRLLVLTLNVARRPYSRRAHITAGELRQIGFLLQENIPDRAFIRRTAVGLDPDECLDDGSASVGLRVLEMFAA